MVGCGSTLLGLSLFSLLGSMAGSAHAADVGELLIDRATDFGNELGLHVATLTGHLVDVKLDVRKLSARVRVGAGGGDRSFGLHLDGEGVLEDGFLRVRAALDVDVGGRCVKLALPAVEMATHDLFGHDQVIVRLPLFEQKF